MDIIKYILILVLATGMYIQRNMGLADNGDFIRSIRPFTTGPVGFNKSFPDNEEDKNKRFFNYWMPYWKLNLQKSIPKTSAIFIWLPGVLLNILVYSRNILYFPIVTLFPKIFFVIFLFLMFRWIKSGQNDYTIIFYITLGVPITLLLTTRDYLLYFNSFYQEPAAFVFLLLLIISILLLKKSTKWFYWILFFISLILITTAKASCIYWPFIVLPIMCLIFPKKSNSLRMIIVAIIIILILIPVSIKVAKNRTQRPNLYHSLFYGALIFSDNPSEHLKTLGMEEAIQCINVHAYTPLARKYRVAYRDKFSFYSTIRVLYREPVILLKMIYFASSSMQDISLEFLGNYPIGHPKARPAYGMYTREERFMNSPDDRWLNLWSIMKFHFFPTKYALLMIFIIFPLWFVRIFYVSTGFQHDLSIIGLLTTSASFIEMAVAILGDGKFDLIKHLFMSNILFDITLIIFVNTMIVYCLKIVKGVDR